jgi:hypothetical protein
MAIDLVYGDDCQFCGQDGQEFTYGGLPVCGKCRMWQDIWDNDDDFVNAGKPTVCEVFNETTTTRKEVVMELWVEVFRKGIVPNVSVHALVELEKALIENSFTLIQRQQSLPLPCEANFEKRAVCVDPIGFLGVSDGLITVGDIDEYMSRMADACDVVMNEPQSIKHFILWWDEADRVLAFDLLAKEVKLAIAFCMYDELVRARDYA